MSEAIKAGDVVKLKSGGQPMTVEYIYPNGATGYVAYVIWMTKHAERMAAAIAVEAIELAY